MFSPWLQWVYPVGPKHTADPEGDTSDILSAIIKRRSKENLFVHDLSHRAEI